MLYNNTLNSLPFRESHFISMSEALYPSKLSYEHTTYTGSKNKLTITCKVHGNFTVTPNVHLKGKLKCPECAVIENNISRSKIAREQFSAMSSKLKIKFSIVQLTNEDTAFIAYNKDKASLLEFNCSKHGSFYKTLRNASHSNCGCNRCAEEKLKEPRPNANTKGNDGAINWSKLSRDDVLALKDAHLYLIRVTTSNDMFYKVGISSADSFYFRIKAHQRYGKIDVLNIVSCRMAEAYELEQLILADTARYAPKGKFVGKTECFLSDNLDGVKGIDIKFAKVERLLSGKRVKHCIGEIK